MRPLQRLRTSAQTVKAKVTVVAGPVLMASVRGLSWLQRGYAFTVVWDLPLCIQNPEQFLKFYQISHSKDPEIQYISNSVPQKPLETKSIDYMTEDVQIKTQNEGFCIWNYLRCCIFFSRDTKSLETRNVRCAVAGTTEHTQKITSFPSWLT